MPIKLMHHSNLTLWEAVVSVEYGRIPIRQPSSPHGATAGDDEYTGHPFGNQKRFAGYAPLWSARQSAELGSVIEWHNCARERESTHHRFHVIPVGLPVFRRR